MLRNMKFVSRIEQDISLVNFSHSSESWSTLKIFPISRYVYPFH